MCKCRRPFLPVSSGTGLLVGFLLLTQAPAILPWGPLPAAAQSDSGSVGLTPGGYGVALGHAPRVNGLRINWSDRELERVNGVNLTLWRASGQGVGGSVNGLALGLVAPQAGHLRGLSLGTAAVVGERGVAGIAAAGAAVVSGGPMTGVGVSPIAVVAGGGVRGVQAGGLAAVSSGPARGVQLGGLAAVSGGSLTGGSVAGLAVVTDGHMHGAGLAGLALVSGGALRGVHAAGLAVVAGEDISGFTAGGVAVVSGGAIRGVTLGGLGGVVAGESVGWVTAAGYRVKAPRVDGLTAAAGWVDTGSLQGVSVAAYHRVGEQRGLVVGGYNHTRRLTGVQLGLLNRVDENPHPFRYLPVLNARFR